MRSTSIIAGTCLLALVGLAGSLSSAQETDATALSF